MKIILSRKGFDNGAGGAASPIFSDGTMLSIPIPDGRTASRYGDLRYSSLDVGKLVSDLTRGRYRSSHYAHVDPDLTASRLDDRPSGWKPAFGQTGAAQAHLNNNNVGIGDIFLFFGWFADVEQSGNGQWCRKRGGRDIHLIHGWLQVGEILRLPTGREWTEHTWLGRHPHIGRGPEDGNTIYIASDKLRLPGYEMANFNGGGSFSKVDRINTLTAPNQNMKSLWQLPTFFSPMGGRSLSYHGDRKRWSMGDGFAQLKSVGRGQEFVIDVGEDAMAMQWLSDMIRHVG